MQATMRLNLYG